MLESVHNHNDVMSLMLFKLKSNNIVFIWYDWKTMASYEKDSN